MTSIKEAWATTSDTPSAPVAVPTFYGGVPQHIQQAPQGPQMPQGPPPQMRSYAPHYPAQQQQQQEASPEDQRASILYSAIADTGSYLSSRLADLQERVDDISASGQTNLIIGLIAGTMALVVVVFIVGYFLQRRQYSRLTELMDRVIAKKIAEGDLERILENSLPRPQ